MIKTAKIMFTKVLAVVGLSLLVYVFAITPVYAAPAVEIWWPSQDAELHGTQPFKGLLQATDVNQYTMYWQVDGGQLVRMDTNYTDYPHKEVSVDVSGWNWRGTGPYVINFVTKNANGNIIAETSRTIYTGPKTTTNAGKLKAIVVSPTSTSPTVTDSSNPLAGKTLYVDPNSQAAAAVKSASPTDAALLSKIASSPTAVWLGGWYTDAQLKEKITSVVNGAKATNSTPTFILYNIPIRDCGSYSAGGANNPDGYRAWINIIAETIGANSAVIVLEPDALPQSNCLSSTDYATRMNLLTGAVTTLKSKPNIAVYLDAGHSGWKSVDEISTLLNNAGIARANGFALNTSNFMSTADSVNYGKQVSVKTGNKHFVVDTSRNGNGSNGEWCNPSGRALGNKPTTTTGEPLVDGYLWLKVPGESDGQCNGGPSAGTWWTSYALGLAKLARW